MFLSRVRLSAYVFSFLLSTLSVFQLDVVAQCPDEPVWFRLRLNRVYSSATCGAGDCPIIEHTWNQQSNLFGRVMNTNYCIQENTAYTYGWFPQNRIIRDEYLTSDKIPDELTVWVRGFEDDAGSRCESGSGDDFSCSKNKTFYGLSEKAPYQWHSLPIITCGDFRWDFSYYWEPPPPTTPVFERPTYCNDETITFTSSRVLKFPEGENGHYSWHIDIYEMEGTGPGTAVASTLQIDTITTDSILTIVSPELASTSNRLLIRASVEGKYGENTTCSEGWSSYATVYPAAPNSLGSIRLSDPSCFSYSDGALSFYQDEIVGGRMPFYVSLADELGPLSSRTFSSDSIVFKNLQAGHYTVQFTNNDGQCSRNFSIELEEPDQLVLDTVIKSVYTSTNISCFNADDGQVTLQGSGGTLPYLYSINDGLSYDTIDALSYRFENLPPGIYGPDLTDIHGCPVISGLDKVELIGPDRLMMNVYTENEITCFGDNKAAITVSVPDENYNPPFIFSLNGIDTVVSDVMKPVFFEGIGAGTYPIVAADNNGCIALDTVAFVQPPKLEIDTPIVSKNKCNGDSTGVIAVNLSGGTPGYWLKFGDENFAHLSDTIITHHNLPGGIYKVIIRDSLNCFDTIQVDLMDPEVLSINVDVQNASCFNSNDGSITASATGGTPPYTYNWSNGGTTISTNDQVYYLGSGDYQLRITDSVGCFNSQTVNVLSPEPLSPFTTDTITLCEGQNIKLDAGELDQYIWYYQNQVEGYSRFLTVTAQGLYVVHLTDSNGCVGIDSVFVNEHETAFEGRFDFNTNNFTGEVVVFVDLSYPKPDSVSWFFDQNADVQMESEFFSSAIYYQKGQYPVTLEAYYQGCRDSVTKWVYVYNPGEFTPLELKGMGAGFLVKEINLYPNPNRGQCYLDIQLFKSAKVSVEIIDGKGHRLDNRSLSGSDNYKAYFKNIVPEPGKYIMHVFVEDEVYILDFIVNE